MRRIVTLTLLAMLLLAVNMVCAAQQALELAIPALRKGGLRVIGAGLTACLAVSAIWGDGPMLLAAPLLAVPAALAAIILGRGRRG